MTTSEDPRAPIEPREAHDGDRWDEVVDVVVVGLAVSGYVSGISLGDGTYFGRRAGRRAATHPPG